MELRHLRYFESIVRNKKIVKAADELHISQPSLSTQLKALEKELGCILIERSSSEIKLTEPGVVLYKHACRILQQCKEAYQEIQDLKDIKSGEIHLGALPTVVVSWLPEVLSDFKKKFPKVVIHIREMDTQSIKDALLNYDIQMGLTSLSVSEDYLTQMPVIDEELLLITSKKNPLSQYDMVNMADLAHEPFILHESGYLLRQTILNACRAAGFEPIVAYESGRVETIRSFVSAGLGIALIPETSVRYGFKRDLKVIKVKNPTPRRVLCISTHPNRYVSPAMKEFQNCVYNFFKSR
ncbi:LysR family transcriptional regulator [Effusibacillus lacus]|uniref:LysR family transcriptional regulator n=1 Tax=Effusibacillus lacus TaxID=1348429 RepID=A0A292YJL7_9BACL|nr:LysR family transcriptional regulator [Effusibacillus lacus]TCS71623.1 DNA-binding transcriptional LysR family regulator [Effusibacillus lacus]GAX90128.1 LysR family transcriptional regulator [Effusibacillus lacus]